MLSGDDLASLRGVTIRDAQITTQSHGQVLRLLIDGDGVLAISVDSDGTLSISDQSSVP